MDELARFDELGLWSFRQVWFSCFGTLVSTVEALVVASEAGYDAAEMEALLNVEAKQALLEWCARPPGAPSRWLAAMSTWPVRWRRAGAQLAARAVYDAEASRLSLGPGLRVLPDELEGGHRAFLQPLGRTPAAALRRAGGHEGRPRRGRPGCRAARHRPRHRRPGPPRAARRRDLPGAGAPPGWGEAVGKKSVPEVIEAIGRLMEHDTAGDPVSGVKWTRRTTEKVAAELGAAGIVVCPNTVAKLLKGLGYRLRANAKKLNRQRDPGRDAQFAYIAATRSPSPRRACRS